MTKDDSTNPEKRAALALLGKGLITRAEATKLAGVSRQLMKHWTKGIDDRAREAVLAKLWRREMSRR